MSGQHAADAEFDEALALVNEDRARTGAGAARPDHADHSGVPGHPHRPGHPDDPHHQDDPESAHVPPAAPRTPGTRRSAPAAQSDPPDTSANTPSDPLTPPGGWPPAPGGHPTATGPWPDASAPPPAPPGARADASGDRSAAPGGQPTAPGDRRTAPGGQPTAPGGRSTTPGGHPSPPGTPRPTPGDQPAAPGGSRPSPPSNETHTPRPRPNTPTAQAPTPANTPQPSAPNPSAPPRPHTRATPWPDARALARRAGASTAARAASAAQATSATRATSTPPLTGPSADPTPPTAPAGTPLPLPRTLGRTLSTPLTALTDLPSFDTSAMDGWAVAGPGPWGVLDEGILAGQGSSEPLGDGEAVRIATGARIPRDTTAVIRSEHGHIDGKGRLHAQREVVPGQDIRPRGQECRAGERLLPPGTLVTPAVLGLAAAAGYDALYVAARPRVEVLVLGDELLTKGLPQDGLIRDALGPMLPPWLRALGAEVTAVRRLGDDAEALYEALATSTAEVLVTTGGTASGPVDHVHPTLRRLGAELLVDGVAVRPGHPMLLARLPCGAEGKGGADGADSAGGRHLVGLPGNPLAAVSGLLTLAEPLLRGLASRPAPEPYAAPLREDVHGHPHDTRLVPVTLRGEYAVPLHYNGPAMLRGIAVADGLAVVPPGGARRGQELEILDLPWTEPGGLPGELGIGGPDDEVCFT